MARDKQRLLIRQFLGLGLSGESASQPLRQLGQEFGAYCALGTVDVHTPAGLLTNRGTGHLQQAPKPDNATTWNYLGYLLRSDGNGYQFGISNGRLFDQGQLEAAWTEYSDMTDLSSGPWSGTVLWDWAFMCNGTDDPMVFFGGAEPRDWLIPAPTEAPTAAETLGGTIDATDGWTYKYLYRRGDGGPDDGWRSPLSPESEEDIDDLATTKVDVTVHGTADPTITHIDIFKSVGGGLYRFLASIENPGDTTAVYEDTTADGDLSIVETTMGSAIDPFQFDIITTHGDSIYAAGIVEEGRKRIGRVRVSYPGQPWRFDTFDYTDEISGVVTALVSVESGVLVFTSESVSLLRPQGGGAFSVDKDQYPGTPNRFTATELRGGAAWLSGRNVWLLHEGEARIISDPTGTSVFTQEQVAGSSIEPLLRDLSSISGLWISYHGRLNYVLLGVSPSSTLAYDIERSAWWQFSWGCEGRGCVVRVAPLSNETELGEVLVALSGDGTIDKVFEGRSDDGENTPGVCRVGPTSMLIPHRKRFRKVEFHYDVDNDVALDAAWELDSGQVAAGSQVIQSNATDAGDLLDTTFVLGQSRLGAVVRLKAPMCIDKRAVYLTFEIRTRADGILQLAGAEVQHQVVLE